MSTYSSDIARWAAVRAKDEAAEGCFVYCVKTTKIYCRPTCKARLARRANVEFFDAGTEARAAGYRACKRCKPELTKYVPEVDLMIERVRNILENLPEDSPLPKLDEMAAQAGLTKYHFHRQFKRAVGLTPREYALSCRQFRQREAMISSNAESAISTPSLLTDMAAPSVSSRTPPILQSPDFAMEDWLISEFNDPIIFEDYTYLLGSPNYGTDTMLPVSSSNLPKDRVAEDITMLRIHYSAVDTTHGVLLMAFEQGRVCKLELVRAYHEAMSSLMSSFPAPSYLLVPVDEVSIEQRAPLQQQIAAIVMALGNPTGSSPYGPVFSAYSASST